MTISRGQMNRQLYMGGGIMGAVPRENFFLGKAVKAVTKPFKKADLTTTDNTTLYTVPTATTTVIKSILVSDDSGSGTTIDVTLVDASSNIFSLFKSKSISANTTVELLTQPLVMEASEILKVQVGYAGRIHVIASILEIEPREVTT